MEPPTSPRPRSGFPDWVILHRAPRISPDRNETTAESRTREGQHVAVTFWLVHPPGISYFSVHCPGLDASVDQQQPLLISAAASFVLFNLKLRGTTHHFVYAARGTKPSLHLLPRDPERSRGECFGLLPLAGGEHYAVAYVSQAYEDGAPRLYAHVVSSKTKSWRSSEASMLHLSESDKRSCFGYFSNPITVGASSLGWVCLTSGVLLHLRDLFDRKPAIDFIRFPASSHGHRRLSWDYYRNVSGCEDGLIKFVDIDFDDPAFRTSPNGWRATVWDTSISWNGSWRKRWTVDVDHISVDHRSCSDLLPPELLDEETQQLQLNKLIMYAPVVSMHDDGLLYMLAKVNDNAYAVSIDMERAALEAMTPLSAGPNTHVMTMHCPCVFSKYLNVTSQGNLHKKKRKKRTRSSRRKKKKQPQVLDCRQGLLCLLCLIVCVLLVIALSRFYWM